MALTAQDLPKVPSCVPQVDNKFSHKVGLIVLRVFGWRVVGDIPEQPKFVAAVAPHTSNWDFVIAISAMLALNLHIRFMGKSSLFIWPFKNILYRWGGIPIDRHAKHGVVEQMVTKFNQKSQFVLAIAPEGTRRKTKDWKTGFLHIAYQANVPVVPVSLDFSKKELRFHEPMEIGENINDSLASIKQQYQGVCAKNPQAT